jgi:hypothetical protein
LPTLATLAGLTVQKKRPVTRVLPPVRHRRNPGTRALDSGAAGALLRQRRQRSLDDCALGGLGDFEGIAQPHDNEGLAPVTFTTRAKQPLSHLWICPKPIALTSKPGTEGSKGHSTRAAISANTASGGGSSSMAARVLATLVAKASSPSTLRTASTIAPAGASAATATPSPRLSIL